jgi:hypothetical protein
MVSVTVKPGQKGHYYKGELHEAGGEPFEIPGDKVPEAFADKLIPEGGEERREGVQLRREGQGQAAQASLIDQIQRGRLPEQPDEEEAVKGQERQRRNEGRGSSEQRSQPRTEDEQRGGDWQQTLETRLGGLPTKEDLLAYAEERGLSVDRQMRKQEIAEAIDKDERERQQRQG